MDKEEYIKMRKSKNFNLVWFWKYYIKNINNSKNSDPIPQSIFMQVFPIFLQNFGDVIFSHIDREFELSYIEQDGKIIYMY